MQPYLKRTIESIILKTHARIAGVLLLVLVGATQFSCAQTLPKETLSDSHLTAQQRVKNRSAQGLPTCIAIPPELASTANPPLSIPELSMQVSDFAHLLSPSAHRALTQKLSEFERNTGSQIVVLTIDSLHGEEMFSFAHRAACEYRLGRQNIGDGVLLVLSKQDRKLWIYTYKAVTPYLSDGQVQRIIDQSMLPWFKQSDFATGLNLGLDEIMSALDGHFPAPRP